MMREETLEARRDCDGVETSLLDLEQRYRSAKAVLLEAEGEAILTNAAAEFISARAALRIALEEIWPDPDQRYEN